MTCKCNTKCLSQSVVTAIAADEALSWPISMQNFTAGTLHMPDAWTAATIGFQVSDSLHGTYQPLLDGNGNRIEIAVTAGNSYPIPYDVMNATFVKLWSQTAGADVNQTEERRLVLDLTTCAAEVVEGGPGGSVAWGEITGTLSNQTDLQNALDEALPKDDPLLVAYRETVISATVGATYTIDWSAGTIFVLTLTDNTAITMSNVAAGRSITVIFIQDGTGNRVPTYTDSITWAGGDAATLSLSANERDKVVFDSYNGTVIDGQLVGLDYS